MKKLNNLKFNYKIINELKMFSRKTYVSVLTLYDVILLI